MEKYLKMLEKNVQWIALGAGGLYVLWMVYAYVLTPPVTVKLGIGPNAKTVTPEEIDDTINKSQGDPLKNAMARNDTVDIKVTDVLAPFIARIDEKDLKTTELATNWGGVRGEVPDSEHFTPGENTLVSTAPELPKPVITAQSADLATIATGAGADPSGGPRPAPVLAGHKDIGWFSVTAKVPFDALQKAFEAAYKHYANQQLYSSLFMTKFVNVTLIRQEQLPNGQWGPEAVIDSVDANRLPFPGVKVPPQKAGDRDKAYAYKQWAGQPQVQEEIVQPKFPDVVPGVRVWYAPGQPAPDPTKRLQQRNAPGRMNVRPQAQPVKAFLPPPAPAAPNQLNANGAQPGRAAQANAGDFDVSRMTQDVELMVHDITAQPGRTYRYCVKYALTNPVWDSNAASQEVSQEFALVSQPSDWTQPVTIPSTTQIFVLNVSSQTQRVRFDVFEWKDGKIINSKVEAVPGDAIKDQTVVDIRRESGNRDASYVLLIDDQGAMTRQDKQGDAAKQDYDKLKAEVALEGGAEGAPRQQALAR